MGLEQPLVSIAVVTYNQQEFVEQTLISALEQDWDRLEVVVADDGSTDDTPGLIRSLAAKYPGRLVPLLSGENVGITRNCNRCYERCEGTLVASQGGDDVLLPGKIRAQAELMIDDRACDLSYHDVEVFESATGRTTHLFSDLNAFREGTFAEILLHGTFCPATSLMVRRRPGQILQFDPRIPISSDWLYCIDALAARGGTLRRLDGVWARYRRHGRNVTLDRRHALSERLLTLDIVSEKYPEHHALVHRARAWVLFHAAWEALAKQRDLAAAARYFAASIRSSPGQLVANLGRSGRIVARRAAAKVGR